MQWRKLARLEYGRFIHGDDGDLELSCHFMYLVMSRFKVLDDFSAQRKKGMNPVFKASTIPGLKGAECWEEEDGKR